MIKYETEYLFSGERFKVIYQIFEKFNKAKEVAEAICVEQTIEFPVELTGKSIKNHVIGKIEQIQEYQNSVVATISYPVEVVGNEPTQFFNVIMGNCSLFPNLKIIDLQLSMSVESIFPGPRYGISGLRERLSIHNRPFLATAIKPMSLSSDELAEMAYRLALGGIDIIKDDHGLADQPFSKFEERVVKVTEAVHRANRETGFHTIYAPNITASEQVMIKRAEFVKKIGSGALLVSVALCGFGSFITLRREVDLPILSHPAFLGGYLSVMDFGVLFGNIQRMIGADVVIFPNYGGRFTFSKEDCRKIDRGLKDPFGSFKEAFPSPAGGMNVSATGDMISFYGKDVVLLIGGALHKMGMDLTENVKVFRNQIEKICQLSSLEND
ncbi:RuBisCO large subunit C-terminal-like domain-containing protein [Thermotoga profunda]|uniref:RuBisCO large subunit C-terminal-like domain-containing protein n=1 Tax=Thermotoga profunda TaxID=1508420 RepID=UPI000597058B|nr:RuBisCO large subunit C-terminal-like domain-containing protein [Thermotoga profunda]